MFDVDLKQQMFKYALALKLVLFSSQSIICLQGTFRNHTFSHIFTEEMPSDNWTFDIWTVSECTHHDSKHATIPVFTEKPRGKKLTGEMIVIGIWRQIPAN